MKIFITGVNGFIGNAVWHRIELEAGMTAVGSVRSATVAQRNSSWIAVGELTSSTDWSETVCGVDVVIHTAARVHVLNDEVADPIVEYQRVNVQGTLRLARQASEAGVKRFVFLSSVKVNGESTTYGSPFKADDLPAPLDAYGMSKHEAEQALRNLSLETGMEVVIVRPPLVYGPGVKANFASMMRWLRRGMPLPLGSVDNHRSLVALDNLVDLLVTCICHPAAAGQTFLVSDGEDVSTTQLLRRMGIALGRPARLLPVPPVWIEWIAARVGKRDVARRLCGSLQVDIAKTRDLLGWAPPLSLDEGLKKTARGLV